MAILLCGTIRRGLSVESQVLEAWDAAVERAAAEGDQPRLQALCECAEKSAHSLAVLARVGLRRAS